MSDFPVPEPIPDLPAADLAADEALDIQHDTDPEQDHGISHRIPNLGHALSFFSIAFLALQAGLAVVFGTSRIAIESMTAHPGLSLLSESIAWILALGAASWLFPRQWKLPFARGIHWNQLVAKRRWYWVILAGVLLSVITQFAERFVKTPDDDTLGKIMRMPHGAWLVTAFGVLLAPLMEEIAFRGFLMPALATMYDWLALDRSPAGPSQMGNDHDAHGAFTRVRRCVFEHPFRTHSRRPIARGLGSGGPSVRRQPRTFFRPRKHAVARLLHADACRLQPVGLCGDLHRIRWLPALRQSLEKAHVHDMC